MRKGVRGCKRLVLSPAVDCAQKLENSAGIAVVVMNAPSYLANEYSDTEDLSNINLDDTSDWGLLPSFDEAFVSTTEDISVLTEETDRIAPTAKKSSPKKKSFQKKKVRCSAVAIVTKTTPLRPTPKLYVFPSFDKSDAIIYMPSTLARLTNNGDIDSLSKLIKGHCSKECEVLSGGWALPMNLFVGLLECATILYPDIITCMHKTHVVDNKVHATMYYKFTDYPALADHARAIPRVRDHPLHNAVFTAPRKEAVSQKLRLDEKPENIRTRILELIDLGEEFQVYGKEDITITTDFYTKKITSYESDNKLLSVCHDGVHYKLL